MGKRIAFACGCWYDVDEYGDVDDAQQCAKHREEPECPNCAQPFNMCVCGGEG